MLWGESRRLRVRCSASKSIMKALGEVMSRFTQRRPRRSGAATVARGWRIAKYFALLAVFAGAAGASRANAQDSQGPLTPAPSEEHNVRRLGTEPEPPAPPSLHPDEIIRRFSLKEDQFLAARPNYGYRKPIRIDEFGDGGKPAGPVLPVTEGTRAANGAGVRTAVQKPQTPGTSFRR